MIALLVEAFNVVTYLSFPIGDSRKPFFFWYIVPIALIGACGVLSALSRSTLARWVQVLIFFATALLSAATAKGGDVTSALFLVFGLILISEYGLGRYAIWAGAAFALTLYPISLIVGYSHFSASFASEVAAALLGVVGFVALYGGVILRHQFRHREDKALLETRVAERTAELEKALAERSVMLRELHHRVKNNLQLTASLLRLESDIQGDGLPRDVFEASTQRIEAMALVHETLYDTEELVEVDIVRYARSLLDSISPIGQIVYRLEADSPLGVDLDFAVPFGLLLNELASDASRLIYPIENRGAVIFRIGRSRGGCLELSMFCNGREFAGKPDAQAPKSLGAALIEALVNQLKGEILGGEPSEARWTMRFPLPSV